MEFGMFHEFQRRPGQTEAEAFTESFEQVDEAGALGLIDLLERLCESFGFGLAGPALKFVEHTEFHGDISLLWRKSDRFSGGCKSPGAAVVVSTWLPGSRQGAQAWSLRLP